MHLDDWNVIPGILYGPLSLSRVISVCRTVPLTIAGCGKKKIKIEGKLTMVKPNQEKAVYKITTQGFVMKSPTLPHRFD